MADSKITALTSISTSSDPANDPLVIVDVSDTSMAATGTTKKVTLNQLLATSPTATLASATITGDLTVDTSTLKVDSALNNVGIGTASPNNNTNRSTLTINNAVWGGQLDINVGALNHAQFGTDNFSSGLSCRIQSADGIAMKTAGGFFLQQISSTGVSTFYDGAGGTRMTLNATGLGVGVSPGSAIGNLQVGGSTNANLYTQQGTDTVRMGVRASGRTGIILDSSNATYTNRAWYLDNAGSSGSLVIGRQGLDVITFDNSGNVGISVTPSAWGGGYTAIQNRQTAWWSSASRDFHIGANVYYDGTDELYIGSAQASKYTQYQGAHYWYSAPSGTAGNAITFTQAMTLSASGRLFVGATSITAGYSGNNYLIVGGIGSPTIKLQSTTGPNAWDIYTSNGADLFVAKNSSDLGSFNSTTGVYTALSDANKKRDFEPSNIGLAEVLQLQPKLFRMVDDADDAPKELGFVAQDVKSVIPQAYVEQSGQKGVFIGLQDRPIIAALTRAIQELTARVQTLEAK